MLFQKLQEVAASVPTTSGVRSGGRLYPYAQLVERVERLAAGFQSVGISQGDTVAILMPNSVDIFLAAHALFALGAVAVPLNFAGNPKELQWAAEKCEIAAIITRPELIAVAERLQADIGRTVPLITTGDNGPLSYAELEKTPPVRLEPQEPDRHAVYLFSSGSTGRSKIVPQTHFTAWRMARISTGAMGTTHEDVILNGMPSHHAFGFMLGVASEVFRGGSTCYWTDPQPPMLSKGRMLAAIERERITVLPGVPFLFDLLSSVSDNVDISSLRLCFSGGVAMKRPTFERFRDRFGKPIRQVLGMSECGVVTFNDHPDPDATWASVGRAPEGVHVEIVPSSDAPTPDVGEIFVKSDGLTPGYYRADPASNAVFRNGGMLTGDLGRFDDEGMLTITGRSKLIVEVSGLKVDPIEVEDVLLSHPAVAEAVVVGVPDPRTGEQRLKAVVVKKQDQGAEELLRYSRTRLSPYKVPSLLEFRDAIPKSATGKVLRGQLID